MPRAGDASRGSASGSKATVVTLRLPGEPSRARRAPAEKTSPIVVPLPARWSALRGSQPGLGIHGDATVVPCPAAGELLGAPSAG